MLLVDDIYVQLKLPEAQKNARLMAAGSYESIVRA